jgi:outer membrane protein assembly factor BamD
MKFIFLQKKIFLTLFCLIILSSCQKSQDKIQKPQAIPPLNVLYKTAYNLFDEGKYKESIDLFKQVENKYSFSKWAPRATLMIMYMYYDSGEYYYTLEYANKFKKFYPANKNIDYVDFIIALSFYEQINVVSKDQTNTEFALKKFIEIKKKYPNSIYLDEINFKIELIHDQLAGKEMYIARYYMNKSKWIPAINRLEKIIKKYKTTNYNQEALHRLVEIYYKIGNFNQSKKYAAILGYNYNDSDWYKRSYKLIENKDYIINKKENKRKLKKKIKELFKFSK